VSQQLREAFPYDCAAKYLILDRASNFDTDVMDTIKSFGLKPNEQVSEVHGRTALRNDSLGLAAVICSTMSSYAMNTI
jgi:hypothetical protein